MRTTASHAAFAVLLLAGCGSPPEAQTPLSASGSPPGSAASQAVTERAPETAAAATPTTPSAWPFTEPTADERTAQLARLAKDPGPIRTNWTPPGRGERYGHAEGLVGAPPDIVRKKLVDYPHYKELAGPKFKTVNVVDKQNGVADVYFQLPIMKGLVTIWYVTRFPLAPAGDVIEGTYVKGNIKGMNIVFTVKPGPDERSSVMTCDLVLRPSLPAPQAALDEELRDACGDAIIYVRKTFAP